MSERLRIARRIAGIVAGLLACLPCHYLWRCFGRPSPWPRRFLHWVGFCAGMRVETRGAAAGRHVLYLANHLSWLDIMALAGVTGASFVSKDDVKDWPVIGWLAGLNATIYVARASRREVHGQAETLRGALATGRPVALFPEGTTDGGARVLPFRASLLAAVFPPLPGLGIQPVALDYGRNADEIAWSGGEGAGANALRILGRPGTFTLTVHLLPPIDPLRFADRKTLAEAARRAIVEALGASAGPANPL